LVEEVELILYYCNHVWQEDWETFHHAVFSGPDGAAHRFIPRYENPNPPVMITDIKMWGLLLGEMDQLFAEGFLVMIWKISSDQNTDADKAAKAAALKSSVQRFRDHVIGPLRTVAEPRYRRLRTVVFYQDENQMFFGSGEMYGIFDEKSEIVEVYNKDNALYTLNPELPRDIIVIAHTDLLREREVWTRIVDHLHAGTTFMIAEFSGGITDVNRVNNFLARVGLPWVVR